MIIDDLGQVHILTEGGLITVVSLFFGLAVVAVVVPLTWARGLLAWRARLREERRLKDAREQMVVGAAFQVLYGKRARVTTEPAGAGSVRKGQSMGEVEQLEHRVKALSPEDLAQFRAWFEEYEGGMGSSG